MQLNSNLLGIDGDRNHIRILEFARERGGAGKSNIRVIRTVSEKIESGLDLEDGEKLGSFIREALRKNQIGTSGAVFAIGRERAFWHPLAIPASPEDQVANLVRFQLAQELPFAIEESVVDYVITSRNEEGKVIGVLAAAVRTETLNYFQKVCRSAGLTIRRVGLRPYANFMAVQAAGLVDGKMTLFVDLSLQGLEIDIFSPEGGVIFSRNVGLEENTVEAVPLKEGYLEKAILQLKRTLQAQAYLAGSAEQRPHQAIIAGNTGWEQEFSEIVTMQVSLPSKVFELPGREGDGSGFVAAYGMACGQYQPHSRQFDFLGPKRAVDPQAVRARYIRLGVIALAAVMILAFVYTNRLTGQRKQYYNKLFADNQKLIDETKEFKKFSLQVKEIQAWMDRKMNWLDQIQRLTELLPSTKNAYLGHISLAESVKSGALAVISIDGQARSGTVIDEIAKILAEKGRYEVVPGSQSTTSGDYPENFKIDLTLARRHESKKDKPKESPNEKTDKPGIKNNVGPAMKPAVGPEGKVNPGMRVTPQSLGGEKRPLPQGRGLLPLKTEGERMKFPATQNAIPIRQPGRRTK